MKMYGKEEAEEMSNESEQTNIWLRKSNTGKGLNIYGAENTTLTVSIKAVMKVIDGKAHKVRFSRFKGSSAKSDLIDV